MNKKIFAILFISIFLIAFIGFVSAENNTDDAGNASDPIKVRIVWDDKNQTGDRPDQIVVNLLRDGKVVEFIKLNESNSWNATFKTLNDGGNYKVKITDELSNYSVSYQGNADSGFVIKNTLKEAPLKASPDNSTLEKTNGTNNGTNNQTNNSSDDAKGNSNSQAGSAAKSNDDKAKSNDNKVDSNAEKAKVNDANNNSNNANSDADKAKNNTADNQTSNNTKDNSTVKKEVPNNDVKLVKNNKKPAIYEPNATMTNKLKSTGLPIVALSLVAIVGAYALLRRRP